MRANQIRYARQAGGHYESYFVRANHPTRPLAFWIRYTIFSERLRPDAARAQLWAIVFDGERGTHVVTKQEWPIASFAAAPARLEVRIAESVLTDTRAIGQATGKAHTVSWDLTYGGGQAPVLLLPESFYERRFPAAKSLVAQPMAVFSGSLTVDGERLGVNDWVGTQNHNWGSRHTDSYAWGQVAGFDTHPDSFLEVASARLKLGPLWTPPLTPAVLRHEGNEYRFNSLLQALRAPSRLELFTMRFECRSNDARLVGTISAPREAFVGLRYENPPGGQKICLNSKLAACDLRLDDLRSGTSVTLSTSHRAAFEILTDGDDFGVAIAA